MVYALISIEWVFIATILVLGIITGLVAIQKTQDPTVGPVAVLGNSSGVLVAERGAG